MTGLVTGLLLPSPGAWLDEAATVSATSRTWAELLQLLSHQDLPMAGYYLLVHAVSAIGLNPLTAGRLVSTVAWAVAAAVTADLAHTLLGRRASWIAGVCVLVLPAGAAAAVNARPEALSLALVAGVFWALAHGRPVWVGVLGVAACLVYALNFLYLPAGLTAAWLIGRRPRREVTGVACAVTALGVVWSLLCSSQQGQVSWIDTSLIGGVSAAFTRVAVSSPTGSRAEDAAVMTSTVLGVLICLLLVVSVARRQLSPRCGAAVLATWAGPPLAVSSLTLVGTHIFVARYFVPSAVGLALFLGWVGTQRRGQPLTPVVLGLVLLAALSVPSWISSRSADGHWRENVDAHRMVVEGRRPDAVWFVTPQTRAVLMGSGELGGAWAAQPWWRAARDDGSLWGGSQPCPAAGADTRLYVVSPDRPTYTAQVRRCLGDWRLTVKARDARFVTYVATRR